MNRKANLRPEDIDRWVRLQRTELEPSFRAHRAARFRLDTELQSIATIIANKVTLAKLNRQVELLEEARHDSTEEIRETIRRLSDDILTLIDQELIAADAQIDSELVRLFSSDSGDDDPITSVLQRRNTIIERTRKLSSELGELSRGSEKCSELEAKRTKLWNERDSLAEKLETQVAKSLQGVDVEAALRGFKEDPKTICRYYQVLTGVAPVSNKDSESFDWTPTASPPIETTHRSEQDFVAPAVTLSLQLQKVRRTVVEGGDEVDWITLVREVVEQLQSVDHSRITPADAERLRDAAGSRRKTMRADFNISQRIHPSLQSILDAYVDAPLTVSVQEQIVRDLEQRLTGPRETASRAVKVRNECIELEAEIDAMNAYLVFHSQQTSGGSKHE